MKRALAAVALAATTGCADHVLWHGHSSDRATDIRVIESSGRQRVVLDDHQISAHASVGIDAMTIEGRHVAYPARDGRRWRVFVDGVAEPLAWDGVGAIALSPEADRLVYAAVDENGWHVVDRGVPGPAFDSVVSLDLDARGRSVYGATAGSIARVYVDGEPGPAWSEVRSISVRPRVAYVAVDSAGEHVVEDGHVSAAYEAIVEMTGDGFIGRTKLGRQAVAFGRVVAEGEVHRLVTAAGHYAYVRRGPTFEVLVRDGQEETRTWHLIEALTISSDGEHVGYVAREDGVTVVIDGAVQGTWIRARAPVFARAGGGFAYVASMGRGAVVVTPGGHHAFDVLVEDSLVLADTGSHWAVVAGYDSVRRLYEVVDGRPRQRFDIDEWVAERVRRSHDDPGARLRDWLLADLSRRQAR